MWEKNGQKNGVWVEIQWQFWANRLLKNYLKFVNAHQKKKKTSREALKSIGLSH